MNEVFQRPKSVRPNIKIITICYQLRKIFAVLSARCIKTFMGEIAKNTQILPTFYYTMLHRFY